MISPRTKKKVVLFLPRREDPAQGEVYSADLLPHELLQIAGGPDREGYEVVLVDAMIDEEDALAKVLEACDGALLFASSCILGYQVWDGYLTARAVRERYPDLPIVWGGWFPTVAPEMYFEAGIADAVGLGQGELTFLDVVRAIDAGEDLADVPGLALWRDEAVHRTAPRPVVGFDKLPPTPWHLLDYERYAAKQARPTALKVRHRMPLDAWSEDRPPRGFSHYSSYGCPEDCSFCCSPLVTNRRWKAIPGGPLAEEIEELQGRFRFDTLRFQDANWGVAEKRTREFCQGLVDRGLRLHWNATIEIETVMRYKEETLDLLRDSGCHLLWLGAETATNEMQARIKKYIDAGNIELALRKLGRRGITSGTFWIIGFPGETEESMQATLRYAARVKHEQRGACSEVYPFRAIPGTHDWEEALRAGYQPPTDFETWGKFFEWKWHTEGTPLPASIRKRWQRYNQTATLYDATTERGPALLRSFVSKLAGWRLKHDRYGFPVEQKLFDLLV